MIINLTQHAATQEQEEAGVTASSNTEALKELLTFTSLPSAETIKEKATAIAKVAVESGADAAMIGGAPYLMGPLETALKRAGIKPLYAYSERVSQEVTEPDGSVRKINVFKHHGFVEA